MFMSYKSNKERKEVCRSCFKDINKFLRVAALILMLCEILICCKETSSKVVSKYVYSEPSYNKIQIRPTTDTLTFPLDEYTYNAVKSFNVFSSDSGEYISFHDRRSESVNIYQLLSGKLVKRLSLKSCFSNQRLYKTSAYIKSFDSIFITNKEELYLLDSSGTIKRMIEFRKRPVLARAVFENTNPPVFIDNWLYVGIGPKVNETSLKALKKWKVLCGFDLTNDKTTLYYHLPEVYQRNLYGYRFLNFGYCGNNYNNIVFSFPADSNIYETNLTSHHIAYYGKSRFQREDIKPVSKEDLLKNDGSKQYAIRDAYGAIFFDPHNKRYLRVAKQKISEADYQARKRIRKQSLIIFDEQFKIVGESEVAVTTSLATIFFTRDGCIYARVKPADEYKLHFVRLTYTEGNFQQNQLTKNENKREIQ